MPSRREHTETHQRALEVFIYSWLPLWTPGLQQVLRRARIRTRVVSTPAEVKRALAPRAKHRRVLIVAGIPAAHSVSWREYVGELVALAGGCPVLVLRSDATPSQAVEVFVAGAAGLLLLRSASSEVLVSAARLVSQGINVVSGQLGRRALVVAALRGTGPSQINVGALQLTPREQDIFLLIRQGLTNREIADALGKSARTVQMYVARLIEKLGVHSRTDIAILAATSPVAVKERLPGKQRQHSVG